MSTEANKLTARRMFESVDRGDYDTSHAQLTPDFAAHMAGNDHAMNSDEFEGMARMFTTSFANSRHIIESQLAEGDWVVTRLTWTGLHVGDFNGIPASRRPVRIEAVAHDRFVNGKIAEHRTIIDVMGLMTQIGALPAAA